MEAFQKRLFPWPKLGTILGEEEIVAVTRVLRESITQRKSLKGADLVEQFEREFAEYVGARYAAAVSSCGAGLLISAKAIGLNAGDEVITTPITHVSTATSAMECGAVPVFADIDPKTLNIDPRRVEERITDRTRAIFPVHYAGLPADMDPLMEIARRHDLYVVEDAAHAPGAEYRGRRIGCLGDLTCFSFQTQKNMTTLGEGGMITTNDETLAARVRLLRSFGTRKYDHPASEWEPWHYDVVEVATNFRMTNVQGAVGAVQLAKLDDLNERRRRNAQVLSERLQNIEGLRVPYEPEDRKSVYHIYNILLDEEKAGVHRIDFLKMLKATYGVQSVIHYLPVYLFALFKERGYGPGLCPVAERIFRQIVGLPLHPAYTEEDLEYLVGAVKGTMEALAKRDA